MEFPKVDIGQRAVGLQADENRWTRKLPAYVTPNVIVRGLVIAVYPTAPGVAQVRNDRDGKTVLVRDVRPERKAVRGAAS